MVRRRHRRKAHFSGACWKLSLQAPGGGDAWRGCSGEEGCCTAGAAHLPGPPQTRSHVCGMGAWQVQNRSRWSSLLRDVSSLSLKSSSNGDPTVLSQLPASHIPSQSQRLKVNAEILRKQQSRFGSHSFSLCEVNSRKTTFSFQISAHRDIVHPVFHIARQALENIDQRIKGLTFILGFYATNRPPQPPLK